MYRTDFLGNASMHGIPPTVDGIFRDYY